MRNLLRLAPTTALLFGIACSSADLTGGPSGAADGDGDAATGDGDLPDGDGDLAAGDGDGDLLPGDGDGDLMPGDGDGDLGGASADGGTSSSSGGDETGSGGDAASGGVGSGGDLSSGGSSSGGASSGGASSGGASSGGASSGGASSGGASSGGASSGGASSGGASSGGASSGGASSGGAPGSGGAAGCVIDLNCDPPDLPTTGDFAQDCVNRINQFRVDCHCMDPLTRWTEAEVCADKNAELDQIAQTPHFSWHNTACEASSGPLSSDYYGWATNECPGWNSASSIVSGCMAMMYSEGADWASVLGRAPTQSDYDSCNGGCYGNYGHFIAMTKADHTHVACGIYNGGPSEIWSVQNFK